VLVNSNLSDSFGIRIILPVFDSIKTESFTIQVLQITTVFICRINSAPGEFLQKPYVDSVNICVVEINMYCPDCGFKNRDGAKFCGSCGRNMRDLPGFQETSPKAAVKSTPHQTVQRVSPQKPSASVNMPDQTYIGSQAKKPAAKPAKKVQKAQTPANPPQQAAQQYPVQPPAPPPVSYPPPDSDGTDAPPPFSASGNLIVGTILDRRYQVTRHIATGGMGAVYQGEDIRLKTTIAIKEMLDFFTTPDERAYAVQRFREEALLLADLRHPNIPRVTDNFIENNRYYLIMDFVEGISAEKALRDNQGFGLPEKDVVHWAIQVCDVLNYLHTRTPPIIYRDMKPSNIMICEGDKAMVVDFGIARHFAPQRPGTMIGTHGYAPPEQYKGNTEPKSDMYALAATMHHLLSGNDPTKGVPFNFQPIRYWRRDVSEDMERILTRALQNRPDARFRDAAEMKEELEKLEAKLTGGKPPAPQYKPSQAEMQTEIRQKPKQQASQQNPAFSPPPAPVQHTDQDSVYRAKEFFKRGKDQVERGNLQEAKRDLESAVQIFPDYIEAHTLLGYVYYRTGKPDEAMHHLQKAVTLKPGSATAHLYLGKVFARMGKASESQREYQIAGRLDPRIMKMDGGSFIDKFLKSILS
jgi:serine/threonine protein kinase